MRGAPHAAAKGPISPPRETGAPDGALGMLVLLGVLAALIGLLPAIARFASAGVRLGLLVGIVETVLATSIIPSAFAVRTVEARIRPELLLRGRDHAEIVLGVLKVVLRPDRVSGRLRVTGKLNVFLGNVGSRSADLYVGAIGFIDPR